MAEHPSNRVTQLNVAEVVRYSAPTPEQVAAHERLAIATEAMIVAILQDAPDCADRAAAIRKVREAKMTASAAIALQSSGQPIVR